MRGVIRSSLMLLVALLAVCLISVPVFSGEHPWDSDGSNSGSTGSSGDTTGPGKSSEQMKTVAPSTPPIGDRPALQQTTTSSVSLIWRVSYYVAVKIYRAQYETGPKVTATYRGAGR